MSNDKLNFEQALAQLELISKELESKDLALDKAIELFEKGMEISKQCDEILKSAKQKIERITDMGSIVDD